MGKHLLKSPTHLIPGNKNFFIGKRNGKKTTNSINELPNKLFKKTLTCRLIGHIDHTNRNQRKKKLMGFNSFATLYLKKKADLARG